MQSNSTPRLSPTVARFGTAALVLFGIQLWMVLLRGDFVREYQLAIVAIIAVVCVIPPFSRRIADVSDEISNRLAGYPLAVAVIVTILTAAYLIWHCLRQSPPPYLMLHDEHVYMIQARMLAHGRLWLPAYPAQIRPFFDTFYLLQDPVYAPIYFPGTALLLVPFLWLGIPYWLAMVFCCSVAAGLLYRVFCEIFSPVRALIAVLMLVSLTYFQLVSHLLLSEPPSLLLSMLMLFAWLRWRGSHAWKWAVMIGVAVGWGAITRPLEAICYSVPIGIAMLVESRGQPRTAQARSLLAIVIAALPFLTLQVIHNVGVAGKWNRFASDEYVARTYPAPMLGFYKFNSSTAPRSECAPKQRANEKWVWPAYESHRSDNLIQTWWRERLPNTLTFALPNPMFAILIPAALLGVWNARRLVLVAPLILFIIFYAFFVFYLPQYIVGIAPMVIFLVLLGADSIENAWPRWRGARAFFTLAMIALCIGALPEVDRTVGSKIGQSDTPVANSLLARLPQTPAVVLFRYDAATSDFHDEPVYNDSTAWPDDAFVVRARDLGESENAKIFSYYANIQPQRVFYIFDRGAIARGENPLSPPLGTAAMLSGAARRHPQAASNVRVFISRTAY